MDYEYCFQWDWSSWECRALRQPHVKIIPVFLNNYIIIMNSAWLAVWGRGFASNCCVEVPQCPRIWQHGWCKSTCGQWVCLWNRWILPGGLGQDLSMLLLRKHTNPWYNQEGPVLHDPQEAVCSQKGFFEKTTSLSWLVSSFCFFILLETCPIMIRLTLIPIPLWGLRVNVAGGKLSLFWSN